MEKRKMKSEKLPANASLSLASLSSFSQWLAFLYVCVSVCVCVSLCLFLRLSLDICGGHLACQLQITCHKNEVTDVHVHVGCGWPPPPPPLTLTSLAFPVAKLHAHSLHPRPPIAVSSVTRTFTSNAKTRCNFHYLALTLSLLAKSKWTNCTQSICNCLDSCIPTYKVAIISAAFISDVSLGQISQQSQHATGSSWHLSSVRPAVSMLTALRKQSSFNSLNSGSVSPGNTYMSIHKHTCTYSLILPLCNCSAQAHDSQLNAHPHCLADFTERGRERRGDRATRTHFLQQFN